MGVVVVRCAGPQHGPQVVGDHDVDERGERVVVAALGGDVADHPPGEPLVLGAVGVADDVAAEVGEPAEHAGLVAVGPAPPSTAGVSGVAQPLDALGDRQRRASAPQPGMRFSAQ